MYIFFCLNLGKEAPGEKDFIGEKNLHVMLGLTTQIVSVDMTLKSWRKSVNFSDHSKSKFLL
jgi:hypothetical protein